jgi:antitoxin (DNA-binding transcriptional repressor) of toxin-antitoxin stability system
MVASGSYHLSMRAVGLKVLKNKLSEYVRLAEGGETVPVTDSRPRGSRGTGRSLAGDPGFQTAARIRDLDPNPRARPRRLVRQ